MAEHDEGAAPARVPQGIDDATTEQRLNRMEEMFAAASQQISSLGQQIATMEAQMKKRIANSERASKALPPQRIEPFPSAEVRAVVEAMAPGPSTFESARAALLAKLSSK